MYKEINDLTSEMTNEKGKGIYSGILVEIQELRILW